MDLSCRSATTVRCISAYLRILSPAWKWVYSFSFFRPKMRPQALNLALNGFEVVFLDASFDKCTKFLARNYQAMSWKRPPRSDPKSFKKHTSCLFVCLLASCCLFWCKQTIFKSIPNSDEGPKCCVIATSWGYSTHSKRWGMLRLLNGKKSRASCFPHQLDRLTLLEVFWGDIGNEEARKCVVCLWEYNLKTITFG